MKVLVKVLYGLCLFTVYLLLSWVFIYAIMEHEVVIAMLCPVAFAALVGMVLADRKGDLL